MRRAAVEHLIGREEQYGDAARQKPSDATCTALQLANFWQDVGRDLDKNRIYIPLDLLALHGLSAADIEARRFDDRYAALMKDLIARTRQLFAEGMPLANLLDSDLRVDIELFSRGGQEILNAIESRGFAVLGRRPAISRPRKLALVARAALGKLLGKLL